MPLNNQDIKFIRHEITESNKELEERIGEKISHLPTKDEFFERMDFLAGELKAIREELPVLSHQVARQIATHINLRLASG
jgi:hypothetical protein